MRSFCEIKARAMLRTWSFKLLSSVGVAVLAIGLMAQYGDTAPQWWEAGSGGNLPMWNSFPDSTGELTVFNTDGPVETRDHPFFERVGNNGRACITCHQPSNAMSLNTERLHEQWRDTQGKDPVFAAIDGSNCPNLPQAAESSHSLLLKRGLFRIYLPWPTISASGTPIKPEFTIEVMRDPTGCNTDSVYGLRSDHPTISVYRRPRVVGNFKHVLNDSPTSILPTRNDFAASDKLAADGRDGSLAQQAMEAAHAHEQRQGSLTKFELSQILGFERQVYLAQTMDNVGGDLAEVDGPLALGVWNMSRDTPSRKGSSTPAYLEVSNWTLHPSASKTANEFRLSVMRGSMLFANRTFMIRGIANLIPGGAATPVVGTCATCHNAPVAGSDAAQRPMDVGTTDLSLEQNSADLPLFKITCNQDAPSHPYLGRIIYTTDPGRALVTGKCSDVGSIVMQQFRGLSARAPYFSNGAAPTLYDVIDYYDRRFDIRLTGTEKQDLKNFLSVL